MPHPILILVLLLARSMVAFALTIVPEVSINLNQLTSDQRAELFDLQERLEEYLADHDWDPEDPRLSLRLPLAIQVRTAVESGANIEYMALLATGNKGDLSFDDNVWRFRVPSGRFQHDEGSFDSFLSMIDFHVLWIIGAEYDKLAEFGGAAMYERARRVGAQAMFSEQQDGWARRNERLEQVLDPRFQDMRSLRWVTHTAFWLRTVQESDYEAWRAVRLALAIAEQIDNPTLLSPYFKANHRSLAEILVNGRDMNSLQLMMRLDSLDPARTQFYQDAMLRVLE
ncbi:MAG: DUF4835 family protein [bacterium]|nr:DUF4835 family protein [bacterium]